ncbi:MAG: hypothetical protein WA459_00195 [Stellaceae bacterium]
MPSALAYQLGHGSLGVPLIIPTKTGNRCGHYIQITTASGRAGFRLIRDPNTVCGLPVKSVSGGALTACINSPQLCANVPLPAGWQQVGTTPVSGRTPSEVYGNVQIR